MPKTDADIIEELREIDMNEDIELNSWEADFMENMLYKWEGPLTQQQRTKAEEITGRYS